MAGQPLRPLRLGVCGLYPPGVTDGFSGRLRPCAAPGSGASQRALSVSSRLSDQYVRAGRGGQRSCYWPDIEGELPQASHELPGMVSEGRQTVNDSICPALCFSRYITVEEVARRALRLSQGVYWPKLILSQHTSWCQSSLTIGISWASSGVASTTAMQFCLLVCGRQQRSSQR